MKERISRMLENRITEDTRRIVGKVVRRMNGKEAKILDLGCGDRGSFDYFDADIISADRSRDVLARVEGRKKVLADCDKKLPFKKEQFDMVVFSGVMQYLQKPEASVREIWRIIKKRGTLILTTVNRDSSLRRIGAIKKEPKRSAGEHKIFSRRQIVGLLPENGFKVKKVLGADFMWMPKNLSSNLIFVAVKDC
ncbi:MAG TPA: class I SAM-dependent methyltransferase [Nanoarchaeota archaeon]|nr:class I SAM-dependent methyltransferase [Nanoarchaeota archaeon]HIH34051.1 class I SAM-dependent methyltransferase [Nanoarchaeota archaeon]HIH51828.1 class I SAM-dependent methyltransferase [Nanoarchaeota archaeon]HIH66258.1 class I SAM-dependent methyltransferase [Nanoarchaeota archaeon]